MSLGTLTTAMSGLRGVVRSVYREVMAALSATGCEAIVSAGHLARDLPSADPRITVVEHVPQPALLRQVDLFVTHGGRASLLDAVQATTPVLGLGVVADQPGNTTAFAGHGLGPPRRLPLRRRHGRRRRRAVTAATAGHRGTAGVCVNRGPQHAARCGDDVWTSYPRIARGEYAGSVRP
ncbi:glycosyltransferase [Kitasatospora sp. NPDC056800]|uniref:glycosyltransferase n=1 Tax=Kitasatospora sp. NPDC056800 TaxID=3345948 RepID=UPI0036B74D34